MSVLQFPSQSKKSSILTKAEADELELAAEAIGDHGAYSSRAMLLVLASYRVAMSELQLIAPGNRLLAEAKWVPES